MDHRLSPTTKKEHLITTQIALVDLKMCPIVLLPSLLLQEKLPGKNIYLDIVTGV
jgi:hypothetical protein